MPPLPRPLKLAWSYQAKDGVASSAAIVDGVVYVGSRDGVLHAIDLATGKARWQYSTNSSIEESSPAVREGVVYVGDMDGVVHAVDAATGKARWTFKTEGEIHSSPNWSGDRLLIGSYDEHVYCLSATTGALVWKFQTAGPVHCTPAIDKDVVYVSGCDEQLRAIDIATGPRALRASAGRLRGGVGGRGRRTTRTSGRSRNEVLGIDLGRRAVRWTYRDATRSFPFYSSAAVAADRIVLGGRNKIVHVPGPLDRQGALDVCHEGARGLVAAHRRRPRLRRLERREPVRTGPGHRQEGVGVHRGGGADSVAGRGRRRARHRLAGRHRCSA